MSNKKSLIHTIPAAIKLPAMMVFACILFTANCTILSISTFVILCISLIARLPFSVFCTNLKVMLWYTLVVIIFRFIGEPLDLNVYLYALQETSQYIWRLALILLSGSLFYETTSTLEIRDTLYNIQTGIEEIVKKLIKPFSKTTQPTLKIPDVALLLSLTISFIPRIFEIWTQLNHGWNARGGNLNKGLIGAWRKGTVLVPALFIKLFAVASDTDKAIQNRSA